MFPVESFSEFQQPERASLAQVGLSAIYVIQQRSFDYERNLMPETNQSGLSDNAAGGLAYITIIPAIIFPDHRPFNKNSYVRFHSWQCIFLSIVWLAVDVVLGIIPPFILPFAGFVFLALWPRWLLAFFILFIVCLLNAFNGKRFKLPFIGNLAEKQANG